MALGVSLSVSPANEKESEEQHETDPFDEKRCSAHGQHRRKAGHAARLMAQSVLTMQPETLRMILTAQRPRAMSCARIAGIMAAKRTAELIPMCHPIPIESVDIAIEAVSETQVRVVSNAALLAQDRH